MKPYNLINLYDIPSSSETRHSITVPWWRELWQRFHHTSPWSLHIDDNDPGCYRISLRHRDKGLVRRWSDSHARLLIHHPSCHQLMGTSQQRALEQHQVAHILMAAAAIELMLNRLDRLQHPCS